MFNGVVMNNLKVLDKWYNSFKSFPCINFQQVKDLTFQMLNEYDSSRKKDLCEKAFIGMTNSMYTALKNSKLIYLAENDDEMQDYIAAACEYVIEEITSGHILNYSFFSFVFHRDFYNNICTKVMAGKTRIEMHVGLSEAKLVKLLGQNLPFSEDLNTNDLLLRCEKINPNITTEQKYQLNKLIIFITQICQKYNFTITDLNYYFRLLLNKAINKGIVSFISESNNVIGNEEDFENELDLRAYIQKYSPNYPISKEILMRYYGFYDGTPWSYQELSETFNMSVRNVSRLTCYFENFMGGFKNVRKCANLYGYDINNKEFAKRKRDYVKKPWPRSTAKNRWK